MDLQQRREQLEGDIRKAMAEITRLREFVLRMQGAIALIDEQLKAQVKVKEQEDGDAPVLQDDVRET